MVWMERTVEEGARVNMREIENPALETGDGESETPMVEARATLPAPMTEAQIKASNVGGVQPAWPRLFEREAARVRGALGERVLLLEHADSTSVPGLAAKPRIDMLLVVANSADEPAYVPDLEAAGYRLQVREPDWYEHRMFKG